MNLATKPVEQARVILSQMVAIGASAGGSFARATVRRDCANGLQSLHRAGHRTIVQDQATSALFGMPKAAIALKAATEVLPLDKIGPRLAVLLNQKN